MVSEEEFWEGSLLPEFWEADKKKGTESTTLTLNPLEFDNARALGISDGSCRLTVTSANSDSAA
jgi:hypothetical protein